MASCEAPRPQDSSGVRVGAEAGRPARASPLGRQGRGRWAGMGMSRWERVALGNQVAWELCGWSGETLLACGGRWVLKPQTRRAVWEGLVWERRVRTSVCHLLRYCVQSDICCYVRCRVGATCALPGITELSGPQAPSPRIKWPCH